LELKENIDSSKGNLTGEDILKQINPLEEELEEFILKSAVKLPVSDNETAYCEKKTHYIYVDNYY